MRQIRGDGRAGVDGRRDAAPDIGTAESWGYVVTPGGRVIKASERNGEVLDDRGHRLGSTVIGDGQPVGAIVRAA
ncbi:MAG: hypothetical protein OEM67_06855 [Thermoleophilia bacterium]|nr:hypothetical protein [Thermoleophilia bacterium]MDH3725470.1 hypothetical protein [Thermoleophilia bacterium]